MSNQLSTLEEFDIVRKIQYPDSLYGVMTPENKRNVAFLIANRKAEEILLTSPLAFRESYVVAGMTERQMEYFALHAPRDYRESLMQAFSSQENIDDMLSITAMMDEEMGKGSMENQQRLKRIIRYLRDNQIVFRF